jgi:hypothetical protein
MNKQDTLNKIKENLKSLLKFSNSIKSFSNFDLTDGTMITSSDSELEIGSPVFGIDDAGNQTPLEDGQYVLTDGTTITVSNGIVESISGDENEEEDIEEDMKADDTATADTSSDTKPSDAASKVDDTKSSDSSDVDSRLSDIEKSIEDILAILTKMGGAQSDVNEQMMNKLKSFSEENGAEPIKNTKKGSVNYKQGKTNFAEDIKEFMKIKNKNK